METETKSIAEFTSLIGKGSAKTIKWIKSKYRVANKCQCFENCSHKILPFSILVHLKNKYEEKIFLCDYTNENTTLSVVKQFRAAECHHIQVKGGEAKEFLYFKRTQTPTVYTWGEFDIYHLE